MTATAFGQHLLNAFAIHDRRPVDAREAFRIEPRLEVGERAGDKMALAARVHARVVAFRLVWVPSMYTSSRGTGSPV
jgi:hypothetical protein